MELVEATLTPVQRRAGAARVRWTDLARQQRDRGRDVRVLAPGEDVVLEVDGHSRCRGRVLSYLGVGAEGSYVIAVGAPLSRRAGARREPVVQDVEVRVVPGQRRAADAAPRFGGVSLYL